MDRTILIEIKCGHAERSCFSDARFGSLGRGSIRRFRVFLRLLTDSENLPFLKLVSTLHLDSDIFFVLIADIFAEGPLQNLGMPIFYECYPIPDLRVIPVSNILTRACLAPCFLDGMCEYYTIPHRFAILQRRHFEGGLADNAVPTGRGSKLYELNLYAMNLGRAKERTVSLEDEMAQRKARKAADFERAASKRRETWANKRAAR